jgi:hypothetical protein
MTGQPKRPDNIPPRGADGPPDSLQPRAADEPPWTLNQPVVTITRPQPPPIVITAPPAPAAITVAWPRVRVTQDRPPPAPRVIRLAAPPQGPWRLPCPQLRNMVLPARRR